MFLKRYAFLDILPDFCQIITKCKIKEPKDTYIFLNDMHFWIFCMIFFSSDYNKV